MRRPETTSLLRTALSIGALLPGAATAHGAEQAIASIVVVAGTLGLVAGVITAAGRRKAPVSFVVAFSFALVIVALVLAFAETSGNPLVDAFIVGVFSFLPAVVAFTVGIVIVNWFRGAYRGAQRDS